MGDFTSKYKVTYSDGTSATESRVDAGKVFDNAVVPIVLLVILVLALVATIPLIVLIPLFLYIYKPYKKLKNIIKSNPEAKEYESELLKESGFKNLNSLYNSTKFKFYLFILFGIGMSVGIDMMVFEDGAKRVLNDLGDKSLESFLYSLVAAFFIYPAFIALTWKNKKLITILLDEKEGFLFRFIKGVMKPFVAFGAKFPKTSKSIKYTSLAALLFLGTMIYIEYDRAIHYEAELYLDWEEKEHVQEIMQNSGVMGVGINDVYGGNVLLYSVSAKLYDMTDIDFFRDIKYSTKDKTFLQVAATIVDYNSIGDDGYKSNYKKVINALTNFKELGGDLNILNNTEGLGAAAYIDSIEAYYAFNKFGISTKDHGKTIVKNIVHNLRSKDEGYSKKFAKLVKKLGLAKEEAQELYRELEEKEGWLSYYKQISALKEIKKIAGIN
jgi:hypothetical protein